MGTILAPCCLATRGHNRACCAVLCSLDAPSAPRLLGRLLGSAAASGMLGLDFVAKAGQSVESAEPRRNFVAAALLAVKVRHAALCCALTDFSPASAVCCTARPWHHALSAPLPSSERL